MIAKEEREAIIEAIGPHYVAKFKKWCERHKRFSLKGKPYSKIMLSRVLNEKDEMQNDRIEQWWFDFADECLRKKEKDARIRKNFVERVKTADI